MIFLNPQWQGAGNIPGLEMGARAMAEFLKLSGIIEVPLSNLPLIREKDIEAYAPLLNQLAAFRGLLEQYSPDRVMTIAGDCGIELIPVSYLNHRYNGDLAVLWFDGHADLNSPGTSPSGHFHGMPVRALLGEGDAAILGTSFSVLRPDQFVYLGVNDLDAPEKEYISMKQMKLVAEPGFPNLKAVLDTIRPRQLYLHFDWDVLSQDHFPHTPFPNKTGWSIADALSLIRRLRHDYTVVGAAVTESLAMGAEQLAPVKDLLYELLLRE